MSISGGSLFMLLALGLLGAVSSKDPLFGVKLSSGGSAIVRIGTDIVKAFSSTALVHVGLCGRSSCCSVSFQGYYNGHPGKVTTYRQNLNTVASNGRSTTVQSETDPLKGNMWVPENDTIVLHVASKHGMFIVKMADGLCGQSSRQVMLQCKEDESQLQIESSVVGSHWVFTDEEALLRGPVLTPGQQITLTMVVDSGCSNSYYDTTYNWLQVGLCGMTECASAWITAPQSAGAGNIAYAGGLTVSNNANDNFYVQYQEWPTVQKWTAGTYDLQVSYHPDGLLQVWMRTDTVAQVPLPAGWDGASGLELKARQQCSSLSYSNQGTKSRSELPAPQFPTPIRSGPRPPPVSPRNF